MHSSPAARLLTHPSPESGNNVGTWSCSCGGMNAHGPQGMQEDVVPQGDAGIQGDAGACGPPVGCKAPRDAGISSLRVGHVPVVLMRCGHSPLWDTDGPFPAEPAPHHTAHPLRQQVGRPRDKCRSGKHNLASKPTAIPRGLQAPRGHHQPAAHIPDPMTRKSHDL